MLCYVYWWLSIAAIDLMVYNLTYLHNVDKAFSTEFAWMWEWGESKSFDVATGFNLAKHTKSSSVKLPLKPL